MANYRFPAHHCRAACRFPLFPQQLIHHSYLSTLLPAAVLCLRRESARLLLQWFSHLRLTSLSAPASSLASSENTHPHPSSCLSLTAANPLKPRHSSYSCFLFHRMTKHPTPRFIISVHGGGASQSSHPYFSEVHLPSPACYWCYSSFFTLFNSTSHLYSHFCNSSTQRPVSCSLHKAQTHCVHAP